MKCFNLSFSDNKLIMEGSYIFEDENVNKQRLQKAARSRWIGGLDIKMNEDKQQVIVRFFYEFEEHDMSPYRLRKSISQIAIALSQAMDTMIEQYEAFENQ